MEQTAYQMLDIGQLLANDATVSQNKYGFFLCRKGEADILLDNHSFHIEAGVLCLYTPYTFIRIIRHTDNIEGCLMEGELDTIQSALSNIPAAERFAIRSHPCVKLGTAECQRLEQAVEMLTARTELLRKAEKPRSVRLLHTLVQALLQALCLEGDALVPQVVVVHNGVIACSFYSKYSHVHSSPLCQPKANRRLWLYFVFPQKPGVSSIQACPPARPRRNPALIWALSFSVWVPRAQQ